MSQPAYYVSQRWAGTSYAWDVYEGDRRISREDMSHDDAVVLCERLNLAARHAGADRDSEQK